MSYGQSNNFNSCSRLSGHDSRLLPKKNFKEPTRPKAKKLGAQHVKC